jgi:hypothetical protein
MIEEANLLYQYAKDFPIFGTPALVWIADAWFLMYA